MTIEFDLFGLRFRAWYALSESQTHRVLRVSTRGLHPEPGAVRRGARECGRAAGGSQR